MAITVAVVVYTHDLAKGVMVGVVLSALIFGWRMAKLSADKYVTEQGIKHYRIRGQMFFGTMSHFAELFDAQGDPEQIVIDLSASHVWDHSAVTAIAKILVKYEALGKKATIIGLNEESKKLIDRVGLSVSGGH
jgi:SulP family sulfate permease